MKISTKGRYALRVMIDLAEHNTGEYIPLMDIARRQDISEKYLEAIVATENIEANEEDLKKEFEKMAQMYQMEASQIEGMIPEEQKENMKKDIAVQKAVEFVLDQANVTEATEELDFEEK